ncbi:MAG: rare lipoprotein [Frankiales bacterium]|nr:rare lipoprotein [Frankiales bacterium]
MSVGEARSGANRGSRRARTLAVLSLTLAVGTAGSAAAAPTKPSKPGKPAVAAVSTASLTALQRRLDAVTAQSQRSADAILHSAAESASLRISLDDIAAQQAQARAQLAATAVQVYEAAPPEGLPDLEALMIDPGAMQGLTSIGSAQVADARASLTQATSQAVKLSALTQSSDKLRHDLVARAVTVYAAQDQARALIAQLQTALAAQAKAARDTAAKAAAAAKLAALAAAKAQLDAQSSQLSLAISPTLTAAGRAALARQQPILDTLRAAGQGYPAGYHPTGQTLTGVSSWYGPGFVGRSTASGTPYDPELLTCAMLSVPLGTVIRVTNLANNVAVDVMVTDRGPYVGNRILDLSHAAAVAVGNTGLATVRIEILAPGA